MVNFIKAIDRVYRVIGWQEVFSLRKYKPSKYCIEEKTNDGVLLYNVLTRELLLLNNNEYRSVYVECEKNKLYDYMIKHWFLIPKDCDESSLCYMFKRAYSKAYKKQKLDNIWSYVIMTTTDCNARCWYCYQSGRYKRNMDAKTALDVAEYIKNTKAGKPQITWFGGEPLYNSEVIDVISEELKKTKMMYSSTMTTNGYLFHKHDMEKIKKLWRLENVQITLDGMQNTYNEIKDYIYPGNAFEQVISNIKYVLDGDIDVRIRLNLSSQNINEMIELVDLLYNNFGSYKRFFVYAHPLFDEDENDTKEIIEERRNVYPKYAEIQNYICDKGIGEHYPLDQVKVNNCMSDNLSTVVINPEGKLTICEHYADAEFIGSIYSTEINHGAIEKWSERYYIDACKECVLYPQCTKIKKCASWKCTPEERMYQEGEIRASMVSFYKKWKNQNEKSRIS